ncbi:hypothetical protein NQ314_000395 [Rhamnusium bicolor]|uniref:DUF4795 domain-containing protein n=1 Tax=Rhamnusium bicolor TaxID=1586634 RepID=A0AAV8ZY97_9CUCU|nr:hypothetical protein NQ314_000395 [Rhamnusium bicolor]
MSPHHAVQILQHELLNMKSSASTFASALADIAEIKKMLAPPGGLADSSLPPEVRLNQIEIRFTDVVEQLNSLDNVYNRQVTTLQDRIGDLENEFNHMVQKVKLGLPAGDASSMEGQGMSEMHSKLMELQEAMTNMTGTAQKLMDERDERQHALDVMLEQVELLKTVKADREDLEDALADKADACQINKKVSLEQFDAACGDMSKAIEEALTKLTQQENLWSQALDDIQKDVGNKLDRMELTPLRDFINKKLKNLQEKFKALSALKKDAEAAGTRSRFLKNVNCISCDKEVIMRKEVDSSLYPKPYALPPTRSMGPYLAYELDQLRKQQKCVPASKNLNAFENAMQSARSAKSPDHICNRYCGGSHTVTTPQQRVTRIGHFLEQWGPEIGPANDMNIRGTDGQV